MGYTKIISYGNLLELYEYERHPEQYSDEQRACALATRLKNLALRRKDEGQQVESVQTKRPDSARRAGVSFKRLVLANLGGDDHPILASLTYAENVTEIRRALEDFRTFAKSMRGSFGEKIRYIAVPEFQKRGAVHFHALFWGLPSDMAERERHTRVVATLWKRGFVDLVQTDGSQKLSTYLAKYMVKGFLDPRLFRHKAYYFSRNCLRPKIDKQPIVISYVYEHGLSPETTLQDRSFSSQWLGKGRFRLFAI